NQIEPFTTQPRCFTTAVFKRHVPGKDTARDGLLEPALAGDRCGSWRLHQSAGPGRSKTQYEISTTHPYHPHQFSIAKANNVSPPETTRYCVPSRSYVTGPLLMEAPRLACHRGSPVRAFIATKLPDGSPVKTKLPAVLKTP